MVKLEKDIDLHFIKKGKNQFSVRVECMFNVVLFIIFQGQFIYATVVVEPLDFESNRILVLAKPELTEFLSHLSRGKVPYRPHVVLMPVLNARVSEPACFGAAPAPGIFYPEPARAPAPGKREHNFEIF